MGPRKEKSEITIDHQYEKQIEAGGSPVEDEALDAVTGGGMQGPGKVSFQIKK